MQNEVITGLCTNAKRTELQWFKETERGGRREPDSSGWEQEKVAGFCEHGNEPSSSLYSWNSWTASFWKSPMLGEVT